MALLLAAAVMAVPLIQLVPLPAALWAQLPGRQEAALAPALAGISPGWASMSLAPDRTWAAALGLIPAMGVFLACLVLDSKDRFRLVLVVLGGAALSMVLGALQLAEGGDAFHVSPNSADGSVTGFFVNRNHLATFLLMSLVFAAALAASSRRWPMTARVLSWGCALLSLLVVVTLAAIRSRAGIIILAPAMVLCLLIIVRSGEVRRSARLLRLWTVGVVGAGAAVLTFGLSPIVARFENSDGGRERFERWPDVLEAAGRYQPLGAGLGSFRSVYGSVEPIAELDGTFFNHAHNDYLELWLEAGWLGIAALAVAIVWAAPRWARQWRKPASGHRDPLALAAGAALVLIALHSIVDFPIRSMTNLVLVGLCLGLIAAAEPRRKTAADRAPTA